MIEVYAGASVLSSCCRAAGLRTCAMDINLWAERRQSMRMRLPPMHNPLDLREASGMAPFCCIGNQHHDTCVACTQGQLRSLILRLLLKTILEAKCNLVASFGLVCSSWVVVSRGSTHRSFFMPLGDESCAAVADGNLLTARSPAWSCLFPLRVLMHASR